MNPSSSDQPAALLLPPRLLDQIRSPADVKALPLDQLPRLAQEIRDEIIAVTSKTGGHVAPNLGVVELTLALHRVFNTPEDQFVFDVAHQGYVHKLLTGRGGAAFRKLRQTGGVSGFLYRPESPHDAFGAGHAGTALSAALGMATARDLRGSKEHVVAICGDAAFTCGITMEALNNVVACTKRLIVILNDNEWSIARNVGAMAKYLNRLSTSPTYNKIHHDLEKFFTGLPHGHEMHHLWVKWKRETKDFFVESSLFEKYGLRYIGPIDGHNIGELIKNLEFARQSDTPILLHVLTKKGQGLQVAVQHPEKFHGASPYDPLTGESRKPAPGTPPNYQDVFGQALVRFAKADPRIVGITAAMPSGTGLSRLAAECPRQFFDIGIAEEHAALFAAGLATKGFKPVVAIYSTFLQRAYDPDHSRRVPAEPARRVLPGPRRALAQRRPHPPRPLRPRLRALRAQRRADAAEGRGRAGGHAAHQPAASLPRFHPVPARGRLRRAAQGPARHPRPRPGGDAPRTAPIS